MDTVAETTHRRRLLWILAMAAMGVAAALVGVYFAGPIFPWERGSQFPAPGMAAAAPPAAPKPRVVFRTGQNAVSIVERTMPEPEADTAPKEEPDITASIRNDDDPVSSRDKTEDEPADRQPKVKDEPPAETSPAEPLPGTQNPKPSEATAEPAAPETGSAPAATAGTAPQSPADGGAQAAPQAAPQPTGRLLRVQVGHFADEKDAHALGEELKRYGYTPAVIRSEQGGQVLYGVQVGTFRQRENADKTIERLRQRQFEPYLSEE